MVYVSILSFAKTTDAINDYIQKSHYKEHSFEIELF
jgi:hypothetical protein